MDMRLRAIEREHGVFLRSEARDLGYDDNAVRRALRNRHWVRVRHGAYCFYDTWAASDPVRRHQLLSLAVMRSHGDRVALSHTSAVISHGIDVWGADLSRVHVTRLDGGAGRIERDVVHHEGQWRESALARSNGHLVTGPTRAVLETASITSLESGLVTLDSALHKGLSDPELLQAAHHGFARWRGTRKLQLGVRMADGRSESVGESRSRYLFWAQGLPAPELQFHVFDELGNLAGITDFAWPEHRLLGEFDGRVKYGRLLQAGEDPGDAVFREKVREDLLRELTGWRIIRLIWADLASPVATAARVRRLLGIAA